VALFWNNDDDLFRTDHIVLGYSNVPAARQWWISTFHCKPIDAPPDWGDTLESDVALLLPPCEEPTIHLSDVAEIERAKFDQPDNHAIVFTGDLQRAFECLNKRGVPSGRFMKTDTCGSSKSAIPRTTSSKFVRSFDRADREKR